MFNLTKQQMTNLGIAGGMLFVAYKYSKNPIIRASAVSIGALVVARQLPYLKEVV